MLGLTLLFVNEEFHTRNNANTDLSLTHDQMSIAMCLFVRFIARPCALGLKIQANGPRKAQANAILEKVFTAITMVCKVSLPP